MKHKTEDYKLSAVKYYYPLTGYRCLETYLVWDGIQWETVFRAIRITEKDDFKNL